MLLHLLVSICNSVLLTNNFTYQFHIFRGWSEFYSTSESIKYFQFYGNEKQHISVTQHEGNFYVHNSVFNSLKESNYGSAIFLNTTSDNTKLLIEESYFHNCIANKQGGSIYKESNGHSVINKVCSTMCQINSDLGGLFCKIETVKEERQNINYFLNSFVSKCYSKDYGYTVLLYYGEICIKHLNMSHNINAEFPCFDLFPTIEANVTFSTFENNTALVRGCFAFDARNVSSLIKNSNYIYNKQVQNTTRGLFYSISTLTIEDSTFLYNYSPLYYFEISNYCNINLRNCTIFLDQLKTNGELSIDSTSIASETFVNVLYLYYEHKCSNLISKYNKKSNIIKKRFKSSFCYIIIYIYYK